MNKKIIRNARIITMNERLDILPNGNILIENGKISAITTQSLEDTDAEITDAEGMFLLPGLINTHTHLPMTMLRGFADDLPLHEWLTGHIFPAEARLVTPENVRIATRLAFIEMIKSGTTCFNDMYFFEDIIAEEAKNAGIRGVMGESMIDFATASFQTVDEGLARCEALIRKWQGDSIIHPSVCVHAPYTCSQATLQQSKQLADRYGTLLQIHVAETRQEVEDITARTGMPPAEYLHSIGLLDRNVIAALAYGSIRKRSNSWPEPGLRSPLSQKQSKISQWRCRYRHLPESRNYCRFRNRRNGEQQHPRFSRGNAFCRIAR